VNAAQPDDPTATSSAGLDSAPHPRQELALPGLVLGGAAMVAIFCGVAALLSAVPTGNDILPDYPTWLAAVPDETASRLQWVLGDMTEPQFYKSWIASLGLLAGATLGWWAYRTRRRWAGEPISYGSGLWPWILGAATLSLVLSNIFFGATLDAGSQPTFVPFVCVASSVILVYGGGWKHLLTGAVLGVVTTPLAMVLIDQVTTEADLPAVVANTTSMSIGAAMTFLLCRYLPWMQRPAPQADPDDSQEATASPRRRPATMVRDAVWMMRRVLVDFTETQFYANEWASIGVLSGVILTAVLNPAFASYGTGLLPKILVAQVLTSAVGIILWRRLYRGGGWAPTYVSLVSVAPATVLTYNGDLLALVLGAVGGAILCPVIARPVSAALPDDFHPFIGNTTAMAVSTAIIVPLIGLVV
jgi:hypothetical protein